MKSFPCSAISSARHRAIAAAGATIDNDARLADRKNDAAMPKKAEEVPAQPADAVAASARRQRARARGLTCIVPALTRR
jgi:hypothetical protein